MPAAAAASVPLQPVSEEGRVELSPTDPSNMLTAEAVVFRAKLHWWPQYRATVVLGLLGVVALFVALRPNGPAAAVILPLLLLAGAALAAVAGKVRIAKSEFVLTTQKVVAKYGLFNQRSFELPLNRLEGVAVARGPVGGMFGYGSLELKGVGGSREIFPGIVEPTAFKRAVAEQAAKLPR